MLFRSLAFLVGSAGLVGLLPLGSFWCFGLMLHNLLADAPLFAAVFLLTNLLTAANVVKAKYKLGERADQITTMAMHSNVAAYLQELGYLQVQVSGGNVLANQGTVNIPPVTTFAGLNVIIDDQLTYLPGGTTGQPVKYPVYLFGQGVIGEGVQQDMRLDTDRNKPSFQDILIADYHYSYHVVGTKWTAAGDNPTNASTSGNLANSGSWGLAYTNSKLIPIVRLQVNTPYDTTAY